MSGRKLLDPTTYITLLLLYILHGIWRRVSALHVGYQVIEIHVAFRRVSIFKVYKICIFTFCVSSKELQSRSSLRHAIVRTQLGFILQLKLFL